MMISKQGEHDCCRIDLRENRYMYRKRYLLRKSREARYVSPEAGKIINEVCTGQADWPIFLSGGAGVGKTCIGLIMADHYGGVYLSLPDYLADTIRVMKKEKQWSSGHAMTEAELWKPWLNADVAVLDEIGCRGQASPHHYEVLKRLIDTREGMPTMYISNLTLSELADPSQTYDDRIASRLSSGTRIVLTAEDRRIV